MTSEELTAHLEFVDGIQKAQSLVLRALLRHQPTVMDQLQKYALHMETQEFFQILTVEQQRSMKAALQNMVGPVQTENAKPL
jgi:siroheme synthase